MTLIPADEFTEPRCGYCHRKDRECGELSECERHFHEVEIVTEFTVQCEGCNEQVKESKARFENVPGATLAWCPECCEKPKQEKFL